jgi:hypothetical protein
LSILCTNRQHWKTTHNSRMPCCYMDTNAFIIRTTHVTMCINCKFLKQSRCLINWIVIMYVYTRKEIACICLLLLLLYCFIVLSYWDRNFYLWFFHTSEIVYSIECVRHFFSQRVKNFHQIFKEVPCFL